MSPGSNPRLPPEVFRAYDIRGIVPDPLSPALVRAIGWSIGCEGREHGQTRIAVGRDGRLTGPELKEALTEGLEAAGMAIVDVGRVPTPVLYFAAQRIGSGVMVTGSHNPPDYNGLKITLAGKTLFGERIRGLHDRIASAGGPAGLPPSAPQRAEGTPFGDHLADDYFSAITARISSQRSFRVVIDAGNGVAGAFAPRLLRALGHDVVEIHCEVDGRFPNHPPDTSVPENYRDLAASVREEKADLGLAFDGDGDRLGVVDAAGEIVWPDRFMMLYADEILARRPGATIVYDVKCTRHLGEFIAARGGRAVMERTGHSYIKETLKETGAAFAGEMSGHLFFSDRWLGFDDALYAAARLLEVLGTRPETPTRQLAALPKGVSTPELRIEMAEGEPRRLMERLHSALVDAPGLAGARFDTRDGVRADLPDGWVLIRPSNTTPSLMLRLEADSEAALERIAGDVRSLFARLAPELRTPL